MTLKFHKEIKVLREHRRSYNFVQFERLDFYCCTVKLPKNLIDLISIVKRKKKALWIPKVFRLNKVNEERRNFPHLYHLGCRRVETNIRTKIRLVLREPVEVGPGCLRFMLVYVSTDVPLTLVRPWWVGGSSICKMRTRSTSDTRYRLKYRMT